MKRSLTTNQELKSADPDRVPSILISIAGASVALLHLYAAFSPSGSNWGFHHLAFFSDVAKIGVPALMLLILVPKVQDGAMRMLDRLVGTIARLPSRWKVLLWFVSIAMIPACLWIGRQKTFFLGDGFMIIQWLGGIQDAADIPKRFAHEPFTGYLQWKLSLWLSTLHGIAGPSLAVQWLSIVAGTGAIVAFALVTRLIVNDAVQRVLLFLILVSSGISQLFFAYVENYTPSVCVFLYFVLSSLYYLRGSCHLVVPSVLFGIALALNIGMLAFILGLFYLYAVAIRKGQFVSVIVAALTVIITTGALLWISGHTFRTLGEMLATTGSHIVRLFPAEDGWQAYTMFSVPHLSEWLNIQLLLAPFAILAPGIIVIRRWNFLPWKDHVWRFLCVIAIAGLGFVAVFNCDIGMSRDWDIMATMSTGLLVASVFPITMFAGRRRGGENIAWIVFTITLLHSVPWILVNADSEKSVSRFLTLPDDRLWSRNSFLVYEELGYYYRGLNDYNRALAYYEKYLHLDSTNSRILGITANVHRELGQRESAITCLKKAIVYDSSNASLYGNLGKLYAEGGQFGDASAAFGKQLQIAGNDADALNSLGALILTWHGDYRKALPYFLRAISVQPEFSSAYLNAGICCQQLGNLRQAEIFYSKFIALEPRHPKAQQLREMLRNSSNR